MKRVSRSISIFLILAMMLPFFGFNVLAEEYPVDFIVEVESGRDARVLQLTDPQLIDTDQMRSPTRIGEPDKSRWAKNKKEENYKKYLRPTIEKYDPDLIIITGDIVYGEFDDDGSNLLDFIEFMDSFEIPWAPVFGNHDNESRKGADWQCQQFVNSPYCLFKQRTLTGNGNYTVGIKQDNTIKRVFFMLDSNGINENRVSEESLANGHTSTITGFAQDQINWYTAQTQTIKQQYPNVKLSFAFHIQPYIFRSAFAKYGFPNELPINIDEYGEDGNFGYLGRNLKGEWDTDYTVWNGMKNLGVDSIFVGHEHCNSASVIYDGVRIQYGQKSSTYDRANYLNEDGSIDSTYSANKTPIIGGTAINLDKSSGAIVDPYIVYWKDNLFNSETEPDVPERDILFIDKNGYSETGTTIGVDPVKLEINFRKVMVASTLTNENVYIEDASSHKKISYTGTYSQCKYTMLLGEKLQKNKAYNLVITTNVKTGRGISNPENKVYGFSITNPSNTAATLFYEAFDTSGYKSITEYNGKTGKWELPTGAAWNHDGDGGTAGRIICGNNGTIGYKGLEWKFTFDESYRGTMRLKVTAELDAGTTADNNECRVDVFSDNVDGNGQKITLCHFAGGKIYANSISTDDPSTGATYTPEHRYIVTGIIDEAEKSFKLSVYDKTAEADVLTDYSVPYDHTKSNWVEMTSGFKGICFVASRNTKPVYALYNVKVEKLPIDWTIYREAVTLRDSDGNLQSWDNVTNELKTVEIDFENPMDESTLTANNVYIEDEATGDKVPYTGSYDNNVYTMTLNNALKYNTEYSIVIKTDVKSSVGMTLNEDQTYSFLTEVKSGTERVLFEEDFNSSDFYKNDKYEGKAGAWTYDDGANEDTFGWSNSGGEGRIYSNSGKTGSRRFMFSEGYTDEMVLEVTADIKSGSTTSGYHARIDLISEIDANNYYHRISVCSFAGGKIYANCMSADAGRDTGVEYVPGHRYTVTGLIDEHNRKFKLSVYDATDNKVVLKDYNVTPYKHDKNNWLEATSGFKGIVFYSKRVGSEAPCELYGLSVKSLPQSVAISRVSVNGTEVKNLSDIHTGDKLDVEIQATGMTLSGKNLCLIVACYGEGRLEYVSQATKSVDAGSTTNIESRALDTADTDEIRIMLWNGLDSIYPLSPYIQIK